jgi:hypothetical protein
VLLFFAVARPRAFPLVGLGGSERLPRAPGKPGKDSDWSKSVVFCSLDIFRDCELVTATRGATDIANGGKSRFHPVSARGKSAALPGLKVCDVLQILSLEIFLYPFTAGYELRSA